jgi:hypothetical protein
MREWLARWASRIAVALLATATLVTLGSQPLLLRGVTPSA